MATARVRANLEAGADWASVEGAAASVAGVTWQNLGPEPVLIAFAASAPGPTTAYHRLNIGEAFYDKNGSAKVWAKMQGVAGSILTATSD